MNILDSLTVKIIFRYRKYSEFFEADKSAMIVEELKLDRTNYKLEKLSKTILASLLIKKEEKTSKID